MNLTTIPYRPFVQKRDTIRKMAVVDRRIQRTRKTLHEALMALVLEGPYDSITVQQILDRANIGRSTFYTHFQDKDELLMWGTQHLRTTLSAAQKETGASAAASP